MSFCAPTWAGAALLLSSRMCTIKQKWKIIRSERGLAFPETGQKVRLNPICQKTEGSGEGGAEGGKLELPLGRGRGAGDSLPLKPLSTLSSNTGDPASAPCLLPRTPRHLGCLTLFCQKQNPGSAVVTTCPTFGLPHRRVLACCLQWVRGHRHLLHTR